MDLETIWFCQIRQCTGDAFHVIKMLINRTAKNNVNSLNFPLRLDISNIGLQQCYPFFSRAKATFFDNKIFFLAAKQLEIMWFIWWCIFITKYYMRGTLF